MLPEDTSDTPKIFFIIFSTLGLGGILRALIKFFNFPVPYRAVIMFVGGMVALLEKISPYIRYYLHIESLKLPYYILMAFIPIVIFKTAFCIDTHTFMHSWTQIFIIAVPGYLLNACITGLIMLVLLSNDEWTYAMGILFGTMCTPIYPIEIITMLKEFGQTKHLSILLESESIIGDSTTVIMFQILVGIIDHNIVTWYNVFMVFLRFAVGGILLGYIFGKIVSWIMSTMYSDVVNMSILTIIAAYLSYFIAAEMLYVSGIITIVVLGIMVSKERTSLSLDVELFLIHFWEILAYAANTMIFFLAGLIVVEQLSDITVFHDYSFVIVTYVVTSVSRLITFIILAPILSRIGYGFSCRSMAICVWGALRGPVPFCGALIVYNHPTLGNVPGTEILLHISALIFISLVINATTMPLLLKLMGLSELSMAKKINMNNCMKYLQSRRDRTISMLKMDRSV